MSEEELVIFDILTRPAPDLSPDERAEIKKIARELLERLKVLIVINWRQKSTARSKLKLTIEDILDSGLPAGYSPELYQQKCAALFEHLKLSGAWDCNLRDSRLTKLETLSVDFDIAVTVSNL
jgi:type I restriction enzyme R subunit